MRTFPDTRPLKHGCPFDAVFGKSWCVGDGADGESGGFVQHVERALVAGSNCGEDDTSLALEPCVRALIPLYLKYDMTVYEYLQFHHQLEASSSPGFRDRRG